MDVGLGVGSGMGGGDQARQRNGYNLGKSGLKRSREELIFDRLRGNALMLQKELERSCKCVWM